MDVSNKNFKIENYVIKSSSEVLTMVAKLKSLTRKKSLIHVVSYMHNTVLVQNLKKELEKELPDVKLVLLKHKNKTETLLTLFSLDEEIENKKYISDEILKELNVENSKKNSTIQEYRNKLLERYFSDQLADLPNIYQLRKDMQEHEEYGLILMKIDNFQTINSFYGFMVGDYVIEFVGNYLKENFKEYGVYRLSGSTFALSVKNRQGFHELKERLDEIYKNLKTIKLIYQKNQIFLDFILASSSNNDQNNIFSKVSMALSYAKENAFAFWIYEDRMKFENEYAQNLELSLIVRDSVENSRVIPYYQAIMDNKTEKISRYECLARLLDKDKKILPPVLFIPVAKRIKVYHDVTKSIIEKSFANFAKNEYSFNINLSIEDIMCKEICEFILNKLKSFKSASRITFELLESEAVQDFTKVEKFINEVKRYGAQIAIDDFGSGYSNFFYLTKMQVDYIKIDGSLIENIDVDKNSYLAVETIVEFAKKLGIKTIAEYVHSSIILEKVKELDIDYSQGFYIDKPSLNMKE